MSDEERCPYCAHPIALHARWGQDVEDHDELTCVDCQGCVDDAAGRDELLDDLVAVDFEQRGAKLTDEDRQFAAQVARRAHAEIRALRARVAELEATKDAD